MSHPKHTATATHALADARQLISDLGARALRVAVRLRQHLKPPVPARRAPRKQRIARLHGQAKAANLHTAPPLSRIDSDIIAELRALGREEPNYREIARQIVTQPELAATQTTLERRMAWQLLRDQRSARPAPVTAA